MQTELSRLTPAFVVVLLFTATGLGAQESARVEVDGDWRGNGEQAVSVSPGELDGLSSVGSTTPTFSWGLVNAAVGYELVVFALAPEDERAAQSVGGEPVLRKTLPGNVHSWTPSLERALRTGSQYAWSVRALVSSQAGKTPSSWSEPRLFRVAATLASDFEPATGLSRLSPPSAQAIAVRDEPVASDIEHTGSAFGVEVVPERRRHFVLDSVGDVGLFSTAALNSVGNPTVLYYDATNGDLKSIACFRGGGSCSSQPGTVDSNGDVGLYPSMALGPDAVPIASYYDATNGDLKVVHGPTSTPSFRTFTTLDGVNDVGRFSSLAIDRSGMANIAYYDASNQDLKFARCLDSRCTSADVKTLASVGDVGQYASLIIANDGFALIAYYRADTAELKVLRCLDISCDAWIEIESRGQSQGHTSMALAPDGTVWVSHVSQSAPVLECISGCTQASPQLLDPSGDAGYYGDLVFTSSGGVLLAYYDKRHGDLRVANRLVADDGFERPRAFIPVFWQGDVGLHPSVINTSSGPFLTYYDQTNGDLLATFCFNPQCVRFSPWR